MILSRIQKQYPGKKVFGVTEVSNVDDGMKFYVVLEDATRWYELTVDQSGYMAVTKKFMKG
jgi:hypothetical protein